MTFHCLPHFELECARSTLAPYAFSKTRTSRQVAIHDSKYGTTRVLFARSYTAKQLKTMYYSLSIKLIYDFFLNLFHSGSGGSGGSDNEEQSVRKESAKPSRSRIRQIVSDSSSDEDGGPSSKRARSDSDRGSGSERSGAERRSGGESGGEGSDAGSGGGSDAGSRGHGSGSDAGSRGHGSGSDGEGSGGHGSGSDREGSNAGSGGAQSGAESGGEGQGSGQGSGPGSADESD